VPASGVVLLYLRSAETRWQLGDRLRGRISLRRPRNFGNPGEFDYQAYLARRGVHVTGFAYDDSTFERLGSERALLTTAFSRWRGGLRQLIVDALPEERAGVLRALILGETAALSPDLQDAFSRSGVRHVLTISGLHVGMVAAGAFTLARWLLARSHWLLLTANVPKLAVGLSIVPVAVYAGLAGGGLATTRAVIMALVFLGAVIVDRRRHLLVSLAGAAILMILAAPGSSREISFQLSFAAVLGLVVILGRFWPWWLAWEERHLMRLRGRRARVWRMIAVYFAVSASALAATMPLTAFHFNQVSAMALFSNAIVVPVLGSVAVALGLTAAVAYLISASLAGGILWTAGIVVQVGVEAVRLFAAVPHALVRVVTPTVAELGLMYSFLFAALLLERRRRVAVLAAIVVLAGADAAWWYADRSHPNELRVTFLSVGQGDSAVVEFPGGEVMLVDGGGLGNGAFDVGARLIAPFLLGRRIARVDVVVVTHPQFDHYGGLHHVVTDFDPREIWSTGVRSPSPSHARLLAAVRERGIGERVLRQGDRFAIGGADVEIESPPEGAEGLGVNDGSLVLRLSYGGRRILLTGDIEAPAEKILVEGSVDLASTVVKIPHHGSTTSSSLPFVDAVQPQLAVVSAGYANRYRLPAARVLGRYAARSSRILRTDLDGAVEVRLEATGAVWARAHGRGGSVVLESVALPTHESNSNIQIDTHGESGISVKRAA
jgi:competence protein ComEC